MSLNDTAYRRLRTDIILGRLQPGQRLTERGLSSETGLGISPIRDALIRLDHDGLVRTLPRKGYKVTPLTPKSVDDLFSLWRIVGPELARLGLESATPAQMHRLQTLVAEQTDPTRRTPVPSEEALRKSEFVLACFDVLAESTANEYLITIYQRIAGELSRIAWMVENDFGISGDWAQDDLRIERVLARNPTGAAEDVRRFVERAHRRIRKILSGGPSAPSAET